ncbi:MAG: Low molecular weight phosphotyrosine protein phosphatase [Edaphobacter sp.]|nr:Low molecular weight phosphotyrosine protein phosphatase [Edaphobacter sp.]
MACTDSVVANVSTASIIISASLLSFPVASSHVISGAILGVGLIADRHALQWKTILEMAAAWLLTLPGAAFFSISIYFGLSRETQPLPPASLEYLALFLVAATLLSQLLSTQQRGRITGMAVPAPPSPASALRARLVIFVCNSNTSRSPMAAQICSSLLARMATAIPNNPAPSTTILSRGISAVDGETMGPLAANALCGVAVVPRAHSASNLSDDLMGRADLVLCMTDAQVSQVKQAFPASVAMVFRLHPEFDIPNPAGKGQSEFETVAAMLASAISSRMNFILAGY